MSNEVDANRVIVALQNQLSEKSLQLALAHAKIDELTTPAEAE